MESAPKSLVNGATFPQKLDLNLKFSKFPDISLTLYSISKFPWQFTKFTDNSLTMKKFNFPYFSLTRGNPEGECMLYDGVQSLHLLNSHFVCISHYISIHAHRVN